jgi:predicted transcriptional regulator YdeE
MSLTLPTSSLPTTQQGQTRALSWVRFDAIKLQGISTVITITKDDAGKAIGDLWGRFFQEGVSHKIKHKLDDGHCNQIVAAYTDYHYTHHYTDGSYRFFLGERVTQIDDTDSTLESLVIPAQNYAQIIAGPDQCPDHLGKAWQSVWAMEKSNPSALGGPRNFKTDFEFTITPIDKRDASVTLVYIGVDLK